MESGDWRGRHACIGRARTTSLASAFARPVRQAKEAVKGCYHF